MTKEIALHCMKSASELESELCEECPIYGQTGCDHCYEDALRYVIGMLEQERTGTWIEEPINNFKCSCCGEYACDDYDASGTPKHYKFCPNCGAKMVEPQESEGEE